MDYKTFLDMQSAINKYIDDQALRALSTTKLTEDAVVCGFVLLSNGIHVAIPFDDKEGRVDQDLLEFACRHHEARYFQLTDQNDKRYQESFKGTNFWKEAALALAVIDRTVSAVVERTDHIEESVSDLSGMDRFLEDVKKEEGDMPMI